MAFRLVYMLKYLPTGSFSSAKRFAPAAAAKYPRVWNTYEAAHRFWSKQVKKADQHQFVIVEFDLVETITINPK